MLLLVSKFLQEATSPEADEALAKPRRIHDGSFSSRFGTFRDTLFWSPYNKDPTI